MTRKQLFCLLLCLSLVFCLAATSLAAESALMITNEQLTQLENNNLKLITYNNEQLKELNELKKQLSTLKQELAESKAALLAAQEYSKQMQVSISKLENKIRTSKVSPAAGYGTRAGFVAGLKFRVNEFYDVTIMGNSKSAFVGVAYNL